MLVEAKLGTDARDAQWMVDELLSRAARLPGVRTLGELESPSEQLLVDVRVVGLDLGNQLLDQVFAMPLGVEDTHEISVLSAVSGSCVPGRRVACGRELRHSMIGFRRWWRRRNARRLALVMRDALVPLRATGIR